MLSDTFGSPHEIEIKLIIRKEEKYHGFEPLDIRLSTYKELVEYRNWLQDMTPYNNGMAELNGSGY